MPACRNASESILLSLSPNYKNIDPCTNFEELVCGGWNQNHILKSELTAPASVFTKLEKETLVIRREILEGPYPNNYLLSDSSAIDRKIFKKIKETYHACMNEDPASKFGAEPLIEILNEVIRLFPVEAPTSLKNVSTETREQDEMANIIIFLSKLYVTALVSLSVGLNIEDPVSRGSLFTFPM
jgi:endothelin-converting enzyme